MHLGFGPMSRECVRALAEYSIENDREIMVIASRNQVDAKDVGGGYVMTTDELAKLVRSFNAPKLKLCRDHMGPYLHRLDYRCDLRSVMEGVRMSLRADVEAGFDLIHIDPSKADRELSGAPRDRRLREAVAEEMISFVLSVAREVGREIEFEYGSEENVSAAFSERTFRADCEFVTRLIKPRFVVGQTGSLTRGIRQAGYFDARVPDLVKVAAEYGTMLKEHNADYLSKSAIGERYRAGVGGMNVAPELGCVQTRTIGFHAETLGLGELWERFVSEVDHGGNWIKWEARTLDEKIHSAGHYHYGSQVYADLYGKLAEEMPIEATIVNAIKSVVARYA